VPLVHHNFSPFRSRRRRRESRSFPSPPIRADAVFREGEMPKSRLREAREVFLLLRFAANTLSGSARDRLLRESNAVSEPSTDDTARSPSLGQLGQAEPPYSRGSDAERAELRSPWITVLRISPSRSMRSNPRLPQEPLELVENGLARATSSGSCSGKDESDPSAACREQSRTKLGAAHSCSRALRRLHAPRRR